MPDASLRLDLVAAFVRRALGCEVAGVERLLGSVANQDFLVRLADESSVVVKAGPGNEIAAEAWACRLLTRVGVPVPEVLALDLDGLSGIPTLVLSYVPGGPRDDSTVARQAGQWFRRVHAQQLPGWGPLVVDGSGADDPGRGRYGSWRDAVLAQLAGLPELISDGVIDFALAAAARTCVVTDELLDYDGPGVLLHNDLKPAHLFGRDDKGGVRLSAIIDWGDASVGDPAADLARLSMAGPATTEAFLAGYDLQPDDGLADRLARYRIVWNVRALSYEHRAGGDWFDVYRTWLRADTRLLITGAGG